LISHRELLTSHIDITVITHQYVIMRTTIALDDDLAEKLQDIAHKRRESFRQVVNETLRRGLSTQLPRPARSQTYQADTFDSPFRSGIDPVRLNQLVDELEVERDSGRHR
jgi:Arc/MetJ family transcription regulator